MFITELKNIFWTNLFAGILFPVYHALELHFACYHCVQLLKTSSKWTTSKIGLSGYVWGVFEAASPSKSTEVQAITSARAVLFRSLSPDDSFVIGFGVTHGAGSLNRGATETDFIEKGLYSLRTGFLIAKKNVLANDMTLIISGWDNGK